MKYYVTSDIHGFYSELSQALTEAGYFADEEPHKLIVLGDLFDRGSEARFLQQFILELMEKDEVILIRGNHEDMFIDLVTVDEGIPLTHHARNGTYNTAMQLTAFDPVMAIIRNSDFAEAARKTPYFQKIIPAMRDYFETGHYVWRNSSPTITDPMVDGTSMWTSFLRRMTMLDKYEEEALETLGIVLRDEDGKQRPTEVILQEFKDRMPTFTPEQRIYAAMIILLIHKRHF